MGLITGLVSTVVHVAAGRNPYARNQNQNHDHDQTAAPSHREGRAGCSAGPGGLPCGICAVALPLGKGRQAKLERRALKHELKAVRHAAKAQRSYGAHGRGYAAAGPHGQHQHQHQQPYQQSYQQPYPRDMAHSGRQEEGVEEWHGSWRASTGGDVPPPAYEEAEASTAGARRRSVEVLVEDEKR
ncbi:hypothetical protein LZ31DRAFT_591766 [Colletotrichum somersetense]|nr:hypothetical protein LZ31DRAFT_591766 [Colletotrichum somersetense]